MNFSADILAQHVGVVGKTGSGKSSTAKLIIEQVVAHDDARVCIIDPLKSDHWGLTSSADGKRPGLPFYILGGPKAHVPLHAGAGKALGQIVGTGGLRHSILDMADFGPGEHSRFFIDFAQSLFKHASGVVYLVIEEAHIFAPKERAGIGQENLAIHWMSRLSSAARSKGIRLVLVTQRTQKLHNDALGSCETLIPHRLTLPADQNPVLDWLKANCDKETVAKVAGSLSSLGPGEAWVCHSGSVKRVQFPKIKTYDNTATPTGDDAAKEVRTAPVDQDKLRSIVGEAVKEAEANDPKALRRRIAELQREVAEKVPTTAPSRPAPCPDCPALRQAVKAANAVIAEKTRQLNNIRAAAGPMESVDADPVKLPYYPHQVQIATNGHAPKAIHRPAPRHAPSSGSGEPLPSGERAVLTALAQNPDGCTNNQICALVGLKERTVYNILSALRGRGYVGNGHPLMATHEGVSALGDFEPLPTGDALKEYWYSRLPEGERKALGFIVTQYPSDTRVSDISAAIGLAERTVHNILSALSARRLVVRSRGAVTASDTLFDGATR